MNVISKALAGIGVLIAMYLIIVNGDKAANVVNAIGRNATSGIAALQGRNYAGG